MGTAIDRTGDEETKAGAAREWQEGVLRRAEFLPAEGRALLAARFDLGMEVGQIAAMTGREPAQVRRQIHQLLKRLEDPVFELAGRFVGKLPREQAGVARAYWLEGVSLRELAEALGVTLHAMRREVEGVRMLLVLAAAAAGGVPVERVWAAVRRGGRPAKGGV